MNGDGRVPYFVTASLYSVGPRGSRLEDEDLVGTYGATFAENRSELEEKPSLRHTGRAHQRRQRRTAGDGPSSSGAAISATSATTASSSPPRSPDRSDPLRQRWQAHQNRIRVMPSLEANFVPRRRRVCIHA